MRRGMKDLFESDPEIQVCGEVNNERDAVEHALKLKPHVVVLDLTVPERTGIEAIRILRKELPDTEVLVISLNDAEEMIREAFAAGARGYLLQSDAGSQLSHAVKSLAEHKPFFTSRILETILKSLVASTTGYVAQAVSTDPLTTREREILKLLAENKSNKAIAMSLDISVRTVETHRRSIMHKLSASSIVELVHYAVRNNLVECPVSREPSIGQRTDGQ